MAQSEKLDLFPAGKLQVTLLRLCHQLIERYGDFQDVAILGIQSKGIFVSRRILAMLKALIPGVEVSYGELDTTFFRDDFRTHPDPLSPNQTQIDFLIQDKKVILIDDVLYKGRTVRAAMDAMLAYGRPTSVELLVLVDRKNRRELPVEASYVGIAVDTIQSQWVMVNLTEDDSKDEVYIILREEG